MAYREVRIPELRNRLVFRFDPDHDTIEVMVDHRLIEVRLEEYRPAWQRRRGTAPEETGAEWATVRG